MKIEILEMAFSRGKVISRIEAYSPTIDNHILKCVIYGNSLNCLDHWIAELANDFQIVGELQVKNKGKLKNSEYKTMIFDYIGEDESDLYINLRSFLQLDVKTDHKYPEFEITEDLVHKYAQVKTKLQLEILPMISDKKVIYTMQDYKDKLEGILK